MRKFNKLQLCTSILILCCVYPRPCCLLVSILCVLDNFYPAVVSQTVREGREKIEINYNFDKFLFLKKRNQSFWRVIHFPPPKTINDAFEMILFRVHRRKSPRIRRLRNNIIDRRRPIVFYSHLRWWAWNRLLPS